MASGDKLAGFDATVGMTPSTGGASFDARNDLTVIDFDDTNDEAVMFRGDMPNSYTAAANIVVRIYWSASSATANNVVWEASLKRVQEPVTDIDSITWPSPVTGTAGAPATNGSLDYVDITLTGASLDSIAVNEMFLIRIRRLPSNGSDDMGGDAELHRVQMRQA